MPEPTGRYGPAPATPGRPGAPPPWALTPQGAGYNKPAYPPHAAPAGRLQIDLGRSAPHDVSARGSGSKFPTAFTARAKEQRSKELDATEDKRSVFVAYTDELTQAGVRCCANMILFGFCGKGDRCLNGHEHPPELTGALVHAKMPKYCRASGLPADWKPD